MDVEELVTAIVGRAASADQPIVVGISGYAGAGKSTLARELAARLPGAVRMRGDDFLDPQLSHRRSSDWSGVDRERLARTVLEPFRGARAGRFRRYDWSLRRLGEPEPLPVADILLLDVIGLFHPDTIDLLDLTVWCDVPLAIAHERGMRRDTELGRAHDRLWTEVWLPNERDFDTAYAPRERAEVLYPGGYA